MADEQRPAKPVVKKVVRKRVKPAARPTGDEPTIRYGRPVNRPIPTAAATERRKPVKPGRRPDPTPTGDTLVETGTTATVAAPEEAPQRAKRSRGLPTPTMRKPSRPALPRPSLSKPSLGGPKERLSAAGAGLVELFRRIIAIVSDAFWAVVDTVRSWRLPRIDAVPACLATGVVVGLLSVGLGFAALELFSWLRGVASGGGTWGTLTFVVVGFLAFGAGELMLSGFGVPSPRLTSFLGVTLTVVLILAVFLEEADSRMAILVLPAVAATAFTVGHWLMAAAESEVPGDE